MAESSFSIKNILGRLSKFLQSMTSPLRGFDVADTKVKETTDGFSELFILNKNLKGNNGEDITNNSNELISLNILLIANTVKATFSPILKVLNNSGNILDKADEDEAAFKETHVVFDILNGKNGLLTVDPTTDAGFYVNAPIEYKGIAWSWGHLAMDKFVYGVECEAPGKDYGAIDNQTLGNCGKLISEYLVKTQIIDDASEVQIDPETLIKPLLLKIQQWLAKYVENARAKNPKLAEAMDARKFSTEDEDIKEFNPLAEDTPESPSEETPSDGTTTEGSEGPMPTESSKHITVTLQKIQGSSELDVLALDSTCAPSDTLNYIDDIINQDEFWDVLTEEPQTFGVDIDDTGYEIEQCECCEIDPCTSMQEVFKSGIRAYRNLYTLHWMANGNDMMKLHNLTEDMYKELIDEIDVVGELLVEKCGTVPSLDFPCDYIPVQQYDFQTGLDHIKSLIQMYIDCIDCAYPNQTSDVQSTLDEWLRYWNKQLNYFVKNQEM